MLEFSIHDKVHVDESRPFIINFMMSQLRMSLPQFLQLQSIRTIHNQ